MLQFSLSLPWSIAVFILGAVVIAYVGTKLTSTADRLADRTGLGEAFMGGLFLGAVTSLPGITASVTAALHGHASLALSNAIGGIAAQTVFLAVADIFYRRANLEHAAASAANMLQTTLLIICLSVVLLGLVGPDVSWLGIHPATPTLLVVYIFGMRMVYRNRERPMWRPALTDETFADEPDEPVARRRRDNAGMWIGFALCALIVIVAGWAVTNAVESLAAHTGMNHSVAGALFVAITTSLPELVTAVAAVRRGALTLAVGGVVGGNAFDTLFAAVADVAYRDGSLYHAATRREAMLLTLTLLMAAVLMAGLVRREKQGIGGIGFESAALLAIYLLGMTLISVT